jgi:hypothetical protein
MSSLLTAIVTLTLLCTPLAVNAQAQDENSPNKGTAQPETATQPQDTKDKGKKTEKGSGTQSDAEPECD